MQSYIFFLRSEARWLAFGFLLTFISGLGQTYFVSLFGEAIRVDLGMGHGAFGSYYAIGTVAGGVILLWLGRLIDHVPLHLFTGATFLGLVLAGMILAMAQGPWTLLLAVVLLRLCGQGLCSHIAITSMGRWFARNRGKAISIANLGMPIGEALLPSLVVVLLVVVGWRDSWWLFSSIIAIVFVPLTLGLVWHGERTPRSTLTVDSVGDQPSWTRAQVLADVRFWLMMPAVMGPSAIFTGVFFHQVEIVQQKGWLFSAFAVAYLSYALLKVVMSLVTGVLVDRYTAQKIAPWTMPIMSLSLIFLIVIDHQIGAWIFMSVLGFHVGMHMTSIGALWPELYGRRFLGAIKALVMAIGVISSAIGPPIFGFVLDIGTGTGVLLWVCVAYGLIAALMMYAAVNMRGERAVLAGSSSR